jgi:lipoprotein signal peptidase
MARCALTLVLSATLLAGVDLAHKAVALADRGSTIAAHPRSAFYAVGIAVASTLWAGAIVLTRSVSMAFAGGILVGGAAGNLASLTLWPWVPGVPNPLLAGDFAFNVADLAVAAGAVLLLATAAAFAVRNRERLSEPVRLRS